jgi:hypothetical protein
VSTAEIRTALGSIGRTRSAAEAGRSPDRPVEAGWISGIGRRNTLGGPGRDPWQGRKSSFGWSPVRRRHDRVDAVSAAFAGPGEANIWGEDGDACGTGLACQAGETHGTEHVPGVRVLRIQVAPTESGRKPGYAAAIDSATGRSHQRPTRTGAHGRTNVSLARRQAAHCRRKRRGGARRSPSGGSRVPKRIDGRRCVDSGTGKRRTSRCRRNGQRSR